jgi:hypothetical protein
VTVPPERSIWSRARCPSTIATIPGARKHQKNSPVTSDATASPLVRAVAGAGRPLGDGVPHAADGGGTSDTG